MLLTGIRSKAHQLRWRARQSLTLILSATNREAHSLFKVNKVGADQQAVVNGLLNLDAAMAKFEDLPKPDIQKHEWRI